MNDFIWKLFNNHILKGGRCRDRMVIGFKITYGISAYHHLSREVESHQ